jgi:hypothetical protein
MSDFPEKQKDNVNSLAIVVIGLATTAILWASVIALQAYYEDTEGEIAAQRATIGKADGVRGLKAKQVEDLNKSTYADPSAGTLKRLAIDHAMRAVITDAKAKSNSLVPVLGRLVCPSIPAAAGKPGVDSVALITPPDCPQSAAAPTPAVPTAPAVPTEPGAPAPAPAPAEVAPTGGTPAPAGVAPTEATPAEPAPSAPVAPTPAAGTTP